jgi:hypothetical protein
MMRTSIAKELKYDENFQVCEDYDLWYRISRKGKILNLPEFTTLYRVHENNMSTRKSEIMFAHVNKINKRILDDLGIEYSKSELEVHSNALSYNAFFFGDPDRIRSLENWMAKLYSYLKKPVIIMHFFATKFSLKNGLLLHITHGALKNVFNKLMIIHQ